MQATKIPPKKVLPTSPIKIFAGGKFQKEKAKILDKRGNKFGEWEKTKIPRYININDDTRPSNPSIKFKKFIIVTAKTTKAMAININKSWFELIEKISNTLDLYTINIDVRIWANNLIFLFISNKSSNKPIIAKGKNINGIKFPNKALNKDPVITNTIPPPLGIGFVWEDLLLGIWINNFLNKGMIE